MIPIIPPKTETPEKKIEPLAVNSKDAAMMLGVCERTVSTLAQAGKIHRKKVGWRSLYLVSSLRSFLESPDTEEIKNNSQ